jgi:hypothetical protein
VERVTFLLEDTGEQLGCLLNPETLVLRRRAGIESRHCAGGLVAGAALADDPLLFTGGGSTELDLDLLFDVALAGSSIVGDDVRQLTAPIWDLAENTRHPESYGRPPLVRFVWGKSWNVPGIVAAVAERLERFTPGGVPTRSWLRMRLRRVADAAAQRPDRRLTATGDAASALSLNELTPEVRTFAAERADAHEITGAESPAGDAEGGGACDERLDQVAFLHYGDPTLWRLLADFNGIASPLHLKCGCVLQVPSLADLGLGLGLGLEP